MYLKRDRHVFGDISSLLRLKDSSGFSVDAMPWISRSLYIYVLLCVHITPHQIVSYMKAAAWRVFYSWCARASTSPFKRNFKDIYLVHSLERLIPPRDRQSFAKKSNLPINQLHLYTQKIFCNLNRISHIVDYTLLWHHTSSQRERGKSLYANWLLYCILKDPNYFPWGFDTINFSIVYECHDFFSKLWKKIIQLWKVE